MKFLISKDTPVEKFNKHWQFCVGSCHAGMAMRTDYCEQLKMVHEELKIERVRFHGIFCDDMHTYDTMGSVMHTPEADQLPFYENSFRLPGLVYDNVLKAGMKPFVELSFMPEKLAKRDTRGTFYYRPNISMPRDDAQWQKYIRKFISFLLNRYGKEEVETWCFEVWNEPDLTIPFFDGTQEDYFHLYEITVRAVKEVDDKLQVGGPSTSNSKWVEAFVRFCRENNVPVDFITTHQYAGDPISEMCDQGGRNEKQKSKSMEELQAEYSKDYDMSAFFSTLDPDGGLLPVFRLTMADNTENDELDRDILTKSAAVVKRQAQGLPVYYTEWNGCATFGAPGNDTRKVAAYDVRTALAAENVLDGSSIWCFSDIFEEIHPFPEEFHGGYGMITQHGIPKPIFYALKMLADAGDERLVLPGALDGEVSIAAFRKPDTVQVLLTRQNLRHFANLDQAPVEVQVDVQLDRDPSGVTMQRIDEAHGNPLKIWTEMGCPQDITPSQKQEIVEKSAVATEKMPYCFENGVLTVKAAIGINDVYFITISE